MDFTNPYLIASGFLIILWLIHRVLSGSWNPLKVVLGEDGRPSTSKLQMWLWTVAVLFSYVALYTARVKAGQSAPVNELPENLLIVLGLSIVTTTAAKGITVSFLKSGDVVKPPVMNSSAGPSALIKNDEGQLDLSKIQMMAWTLVAIGVYLIQFGMALKHPPYVTLPDIDPALMVLMGLGQGAYLGKKLVSTDAPRITAVSSQQIAGTTVITIQGNAFGPAQSGSHVALDRLPLTTPLNSWSDTQIIFKLPPSHPNGSAWTTGQQVEVGLVVNGRASANTTLCLP